MSRSHLSRHLLQLAVILSGLVPVLAGLDGVVSGVRMTTSGSGLLDAALDSHVRYLSGLLLAIGLSFWNLVPRISRETRRFRMLTFLVVVGGLGRLLGIITHGVPPTPMLFALAMELGVTPLLCWWQAMIAE